MEEQKTFWNKHKYKIIILGVSLIIIGVISFYISIANFFFTENTNGELLKVLITIVGGSAVFIGLMLNSDRIKEQIRQNDISESSNSDKRFGEAIGYLGNENTSIVLGGIYSLYQLAKDDIRYRSIVGGLFTNYLQDKSKELYLKMESSLNNFGKNDVNISSFNNKVPIIIKTIFDLLFNEELLFKNISLDFNNVVIKNLTINSNVNNCHFNNCYFKSFNIYGRISNISFINCYFNESCNFVAKDELIEDCVFSGGDIENAVFISPLLNRLKFSALRLNDVKFNSKAITDSSFFVILADSKVTFSKINSFVGTSIFADPNIFRYISCSNTDQIIFTRNDS